MAVQKHRADCDETSALPNRHPDDKDAGPAHWIGVATDRIIESFQPEKIILFGSQARGDACAHSDIDLLVIFQEIGSHQQQAVAIRRILSDFPIANDIVVTTTQEVNEYGHLVGTVLRPALKEGKILYERQP